MKILHVTLETTKLEEMKKFYTTILNLPILEEAKDRFTLKLGMSSLTFVSSTRKPYYHVAFRTNDEYFTIYYAMLKAQNALLPDEEGNTSMFWKGRQLYFHDPDGNVMEILERKNLHYEQVDGLVDICEVGFPSQSVEDFKTLLSHLPNEFQSDNATFQFFGDNLGIFVLVKEGRHWYPTNKSAQVDPIIVEVEAKTEASVSHPIHPYEIIFNKERLP